MHVFLALCLCHPNFWRRDLIATWLEQNAMAEPHLVDQKATFASFSHIIDARLLRALADMGFAHPTLVQAKAIPLGLESRDILARARTGSGKTAAFCIPVVQKIIRSKSVGMPIYRFCDICA